MFIENLSTYFNKLVKSKHPRKQFIFLYDGDTNFEEPTQLKTLQDIATKVVNDEWTIFLNWNTIFNLIVPRLPAKKSKEIKISIQINKTIIPYHETINDKKKAEHFQSYNEEPNCSICFDKILKNEFIRKLPCKHVFHDDCVMCWLFRDSNAILMDEFLNLTISSYLNSYTCPCCRQNVFDWFFFKHYKPRFIKYVESNISLENRRRIQLEWDEQENSLVFD